MCNCYETPTLQMVASSKERVSNKKKSEENIAVVEKEKSALFSETVVEDRPTLSIWPEWSEGDIASEKWNLKGAFEDPEHHMYSTFFGREQASLKRAHELITDGSAPCVCLPGTQVSYLQKEGIF